LTFQNDGSVSVTRRTHDRSAARRLAIVFEFARLGSGRPGPNGSFSNWLRGCTRCWVAPWTVHGRLKTWYFEER
jgi:hypothetical protein